MSEISSLHRWSELFTRLFYLFIYLKRLTRTCPVNQVFFFLEERGRGGGEGRGVQNVHTLHASPFLHNLASRSIHSSLGTCSLLLTLGTTSSPDTEYRRSSI